MATSLGNPLRGLSLTWFYLNFCAIACLISKKTKIEDGNTCTYVFFFLLSSNVSGEISPTPGLEWKYKIGRGTITVPYQERSCDMCACDITPLNVGLKSTYLCLVPDIQIPHKFKVPDFEKYKGNSCPEEHLTMYVRRMSAYARDDRVLIYYFQESLASPASKWYMNLDKTKIRTFSDLCEAFLQQYQYNVDMAPDRSVLE